MSRNPLPIVKTEHGYNIDLKTGDREIIGDIKRYHKDPDYMRNAAIAAVGALIAAGAVIAARKDPKALAYLQKAQAQTSGLQEFIGSVATPAVAVGALGLLNGDPEVAKNLAIAGAGLAGTAMTVGGSAAAPASLRIMQFAAPVAAAGLYHAAARAEKIEKRRNALTKVVPAARYVAPHNILNYFESPRKD